MSTVLSRRTARADAERVTAAQDLLARAAMYAAVLGTAVTLHGVIAGWQWWGELAALLGLVTILGFLLSRVLPESVSVAVEIGALLLGLNAFYAGALSVLGVFPTAASLTYLVDLVRVDAMSSIAQVAPAPASPGMRLVLAGVVSAVWAFVRTTGIALRLPALAGFGLLMLYVLPSTLAPEGVPWWAFVPGALGFLWLLAVDQQERLRAWGPRVGLAGGTLAGMARPLAAAVIAIVTVTAAVVVPAQWSGMQRLNTPTFDELTRRGDQTITVVNPIQSLRQDLTAPNDAPVLSYRTDDPAPGPLRLGTVDVFDGDTWAPTYGRISRRNDVGRGLPDPPGLADGVATRPVSTEITIDTLQQNWLTVPYPASRVEVDGEWLYDPATFNITGPGTSPGQRYNVESLVVQASVQQLQAAPAAGADFDRWRQLPAMPQSVLDTADEVTGEGSDYQKATALQAWLRSEGGFTYSLDAPDENGTSAIEDFLRDREGYCVHFASTMAVMARAEGIPARVAVGFLPGTLEPDGSRQVTQRDAHAWPELYFEGVGWVAFEPTPPQRTGDSPAITEPTSSPSPSPTPTSTPAAEQPAPAEETSAGEQGPGEQAATGNRAPWLFAIGGLLLGLALLSLVAAALRRRRHARTTPEAGWRELSARLAVLGLGGGQTETVRQTRDRWVAGLEPQSQARDPLDRLVDAVENARYAEPGSVRTVPRPALRADVEQVARAFEQGHPWWRRLWSRWR